MQKVIHMMKIILKEDNKTSQGDGSSFNKTSYKLKIFNRIFKLIILKFFKTYNEAFKLLGNGGLDTE
jgi:hypothetical protein